MKLYFDLSPCVDTNLVPKTTRENGENLRRLTRRPLPQTQDQVQVSANAARLWIILPHRQKSQTQKSPADRQSK